MNLFGAGVRRICAVAAASAAREMGRQVRLALRETRTVELRLDWLRNNSERARLLRWLPANNPKGATFVATCRRREGGGKFAGDAEQELYWLMQAREAGCQWCDLEMETYRELPEGFVREYPVPKRILLSIHDFDRTAKLPGKINVARHGLVDAVKIAASASLVFSLSETTGTTTTSTPSPSTTPQLSWARLS